MKPIPAVLLLAAMSSSVALAFPADQYWHLASAGDTPNGTTYDPLGIIGTNRAGAGGIYGSGGARDFGIKCSHCHVETAGEPYGLIDGRIDASPAWAILAGDDAYQPGLTYTLTVTLENEHHVNAVHPDSNGMTVAIEDANGASAGVLVSDSGQRSDACPVNQPVFDAAETATTFLYGDCHAILPILTPATARQRTVWTFDWVAPSAGAGDLTLYWSVVDGDTAAEGSLHDDAADGTIALREAP